MAPPVLAGGARIPVCRSSRIAAGQDAGSLHESGTRALRSVPSRMAAMRSSRPTSGG
jgi:hypothetical protein